MKRLPFDGYVLAVFLGALMGGVFAVRATKALPRMMQSMMSKMMRNMMAQMKDGPPET